MSDFVLHRAAAEQAEPPRALTPLQVDGVQLRLAGRQVLQDVSFALGGTGVTVILGANGAGKSVLLQLLHGLRQPDAGQISWNGVTPAQAMPRQAMVFQKPVLLRRTVRANLDFVLRSRGRPVAEAQHWLARVGLTDLAQQPARRLSGGEAQRLAMARALALRPDVLFLDEPTASLDPAATAALEELIRMARAQSVRIALVTHDIAQARRLADDVLFLEAGRIAEHAPADLFFAGPQSGAARDYLDGRLRP